MTPIDWVGLWAKIEVIAEAVGCAIAIILIVIAVIVKIIEARGK